MLPLEPMSPAPLAIMVHFATSFSDPCVWRSSVHVLCKSTMRGRLTSNGAGAIPPPAAAQTERSALRDGLGRGSAGAETTGKGFDGLCNAMQGRRDMRPRIANVDKKSREFNSIAHVRGTIQQEHTSMAAATPTGMWWLGELPQARAATVTLL